MGKKVEVEMNSFLNTLSIDDDDDDDGVGSMVVVVVVMMMKAPFLFIVQSRCVAFLEPTSTNQ